MTRTVSSHCRLCCSGFQSQSIPYWAHNQFIPQLRRCETVSVEAMRCLSAWTFLALLSVLAVKGLAQDLDLSDALEGDRPTTPEPKPKEPAGGAGPKGGFDLTDDDLLDTDYKPKKPSEKVGGGDDLDLADALNPDNDIKGKGKDAGKGGVLTDDDLFDVPNNGYKPDQGSGGKGAAKVDDRDTSDNGDYDTMAETGTIAGIVSAVAMALVGAVTSYISYQKKKFCFSIQQSLNADMVKAENPEVVVAQEPQVQQTLLQPPNAEPPAEDNAV
ncbi:CD99 antigen-like protein 2 isoform X2 [Hoplias malabaricus]|uniref:CD99 antigen-like protein 2 isoform X2 n=1 Tax=Hoplias malabaricus TaxID=27720 RepID=UPI00346347F4